MYDAVRQVRVDEHKDIIDGVEKTLSERSAREEEGENEASLDFGTEKSIEKTRRGDDEAATSADRLCHTKKRPWGEWLE